MRAMWSDAVSFGMVHVPVKLYSALEAHADVKFCTVHRKCGTKLAQKRFDVDLDYLEKPYRLGSEEAGRMPFQLLRRAMVETGTQAVGRFVMRSKAYPVLIRPDAAGPTLHQLRWVSELRPPVDAGDVEVPETELKMATRLVEALAMDSPLATWRDAFADKVLELCEAKAGGQAPPRGRRTRRPRRCRTSWVRWRRRWPPPCPLRRRP